MREFDYLPITGDELSIKNEPMLYSADSSFADDHGGELTLRVLDNLFTIMSIPEISTAIIDTRVHMLKPGWNPAIPGWHCDGIPRGDDGQPDFKNTIIPDMTHYLCIIDSGTNSMTQFLSHDIGHLEQQEQTDNVWGDHSRQIEHLLSNNILSTTSVNSGKITRFSPYDYHRSMQATGHGWRYFLRASCKTHMRAHNEIRKQSQVYIEKKDLGW